MGTKRILILEDDPIRVDHFKRLLSNSDVVIICVASAYEAIKELTAHRFDIHFLDHDLGEQQTGYEVARWMRTHPEHVGGIVILHSYNPVGRKNMKACLPYAIEMPGVWLSATLLD